MAPTTSDLTSALISLAESVLNPRRVDDRLFGNVAEAPCTPPADVFTGVCIDTGAGSGFCAERAAVAAMVAARQYRIAEVVAVWRVGQDRLFVLSPCARCREFMHQIDGNNLDAMVILGRAEKKPLSELLPHHDWPAPLPQ